MEPRNFSSPDATENSREARLTKLRERQAKAVSNTTTESVPLNNQAERKQAERKPKPLPNRQSRVNPRPDIRTEVKTETKTRKKTNNPNRPIPIKSPVKSLGWQVLRLAIACIGLSVIAGTFISLWQNHQSSAAKTNATELIIKEKEEESRAKDIISLDLKTEATPLLGKIKELAIKEKDLSMQMMAIDLDSGAFVQIGANQTIAAASTIKTPILVAFFQDVDAGKIKLDEPLEMTEDVKVGEAGDFQLLPTGTKISALETATQMIVISDNTATNMIIKRLGGLTVLNQRFKSWGLNNIVANNKLPDLEGTNTISTQDMVTLLAMLDKGKLIEPRSRDRFMDIMRRPITNTLLPKGIGETARIIHKTGDIASSVGDAGIIDMPNGKRYAIAVMVKRPDNEQRANELIRQISRATYDYFLNGGKLSNGLPLVTPDPRTPNSSGNSSGIIENVPIPSPTATPSTSPNNQ